jgi:hypothetical protein
MRLSGGIDFAHTWATAFYEAGAVKRALRVLVEKSRTLTKHEVAMRGSALIIMMLVTAILTMLGLGFLVMADTETMISASGRNSEQLFHTAETAVRMVKTWFDQPITGDPSISSQVRHKFLDTYDLRNPYMFDRTKRVFDHDGNPGTPDVLADGSSGKPHYRQSRTLWSPSPFLDLFHKPFRGSNTTTFMGTEAGPDILIADIPNVVDLIDVLNQKMFTAQERTGRITEIRIFAPPRVPFDGQVKSAGIATIRVTVAKYKGLGKVGIIPVVHNSSVKVGEVTLRAVLSEVPGTAANGPLESCGTMTVQGTLKARWGKVISKGDVTLSTDLDGKVASGYPYKLFTRRISGTSPGDDLYTWMYDADNSVEDPWLKVLTAGDLTGHAAGGQQPFPYSQTNPVDLDHSNLFQQVAGVTCGQFNYAQLKSAAGSGEEAARYFAYDSGSGLFKEWGVGTARSLRDWTHGAEGLFFFDTKDGRKPNAFGPGHGSTNLTPPINISGTDWNFSGLLYVNAESIGFSGVNGVNRVVIPPGEPFDDANMNGIRDTGEAYVNLLYPTTVVMGSPGSETIKDLIATQYRSETSPDLEFYSYTTTSGYDAQGIPLTGQINLFGVLYNAGNILAEGTARHYGSLIAGSAVVQASAGADSPEILFDHRLNTGLWPPAEITFPRTQLNRWARISS